MNYSRVYDVTMCDIHIYSIRTYKGVDRDLVYNFLTYLFFGRKQFSVVQEIRYANFQFFIYFKMHKFYLSLLFLFKHIITDIYEQERALPSSLGSKLISHAKL